MRILVTGADGFIGAPTCQLLEAHGHAVRRIVRRVDGPGNDRCVVPDLLLMRDWSSALRGTHAVIHLAARAHVLKDTSKDPQAAFRSMNVDAACRLAEAAIASGVRRFVFVSSVGVNGGQTRGRPFTETDEPKPEEPYAQSKLESEEHLRSIAVRGGMELVIVRPPLVYGPGAKGNLLRMLKLVATGVPLPLASVQNRRSLLSVGNLADALKLCVEARQAAGNTFLLAEPEPHSTPEIFAELYAGMNRANRLFRFPATLLRSGAALLGMLRTFDKLCSSLEVDASKAMRVLGWRPRHTFVEGMQSAARWYIEAR